MPANAKRVLKERPLLEPPKPGAGVPVPVEEIAPNPENPRKHFDEEHQAQMRGSLARYGLVQALVVLDLDVFLKDYPQYKDGHFGTEVKYVIVTGHLRHRAICSILAGDEPELADRRKELRSVKIDVQNDLVEVLDEIFHEENDKRASLTPFEQAELFRRMQRNKNLSMAEIATRLSVSKSTVVKRLKLLEMNDEGRQLVLSGQMQVRTAYELTSALAGQPDLVVPAFQLMQAEHLSVSEAVDCVVLAAMEPDPSPDPSVAAADGGNNDGLAEAETSQGDGSSSTANDALPPPGVHLGEPSPVEEVDPAVATQPLPSPRTPPRSAGSAEPEHDVRARSQAAALRSRASARLVAEYQPVGDDPQAVLISAGTIENANAKAIRHAHRWMKEAEAPGAADREPAAYAAVVLMSEDTKLLRQFAYALALATGELQAADRRKSLSPIAIAHIKHLIAAGVYEPVTDQERRAVGLDTNAPAR